jgi:hypothetical protein
MKEFSKYVGMDVHKETIAVSVAEARDGAVHAAGTGRTTQPSITSKPRATHD